MSPMSAISYAVGFQCDYPECRSTGDGLDRDTPPVGWVHLSSRALQIISPIGLHMTDFCTLHADTPISKLNALMAKIVEHGLA
jgi:hypothetical protein